MGQLSQKARCNRHPSSEYVASFTKSGPATERFPRIKAVCNATADQLAASAKNGSSRVLAGPPLIPDIIILHVAHRIPAEGTHSSLSTP